MVLSPQLLKSVVERGRWTRLFVEAQKLYAAGDLDSALMIYLLLSELGFKVTQSIVPTFWIKVSKTSLLLWFPQ